MLTGCEVQALVLQKLHTTPPFPTHLAIRRCVTALILYNLFRRFNCERQTSVIDMFPMQSSIHLAFCLTTRPEPLPKRAI
jgi:hypothetical protein